VREPSLRPTRAVVDLDAVAGNARLLRASAGGRPLWAFAGGRRSDEGHFLGRVPYTNHARRVVYCIRAVPLGGRHRT